MTTRIQDRRVYHLPRLTMMKKLFWERSFDSVATDLVSIFIPIYLLRLHYPIQEILWFYALTGVFMTVLYFFTFPLLTRIGTNRMIVLGNLANAIFFILLFALPSSHEPLWLIAAFRGLFSALYYPAFTICFVMSRAHQRTGLQIGVLNAITLLIGGLAPAIGGILGSLYGLRWVYAIVVIAILVANLPLLLASANVRLPRFSFRRVPWASYRDFIANGLYNVPGFVEAIIWPVLISLFVASYSGIGLLSSVLVLTSIGISLYVGNREDEVGERRYINQGVFSGALGSLGKLVATTPFGIIVANLVSGTSDALLANSFTSRYYKNADSEQMLEYTFGMEVTHSIVWILFFGVLAILATWLPLQLVLIVGIILAIPAIFGVRLIKT